LRVRCGQYGPHRFAVGCSRSRRGKRYDARRKGNLGKRIPGRVIGAEGRGTGRCIDKDESFFSVDGQGDPLSVVPVTSTLLGAFRGARRTGFDGEVRLVRTLRAGGDR